ncbi:hypothetical protein HELRODRAFT_70625, partial [Helobdella robusta]|uniref:cAMP-dependent protein kinase n=1 Tax=Helobdella robusta TaxID=6412 RepID=T1G094_HELRO
NASISDFELIKVVGVGGFGKVSLVRHKNKTLYAMKSMRKEQIIKRNFFTQTMWEKKILQAVSFQFIVHCHFCFKDYDNIYMVLDYVPCGNLYWHLTRSQKFKENQSKFYGAQVFLGLEYLHNLDVAHRDLKPENVMLDSNGYVKLTDLGFAKVMKSRTYTTCGSPYYMAPEIIMHKGYKTEVDWWAFGILLFEMTGGSLPFDGSNEEEIYQKICEGYFRCPSFFSKDLKDLLSHLIQLDVTRRLGNMKNGADDIAEHIWFYNFNWQDLLNYKIIPDYIPELKSPEDTRFFGKIKETPIPKSRKSYSTEFADF